MSPGDNNMVLAGLNCDRIFKGKSSRSCRFFPATDAAAPTGALATKHVVTVKVRANATAIACKADHHIVQPGVWDETKTPTQFSERIDMQINALDQQCPVGLLQRRQCARFEWPVPHLPGLRDAITADQPGLHLVVSRQLEQLLARQQRLHVGQRLRKSTKVFSANKPA
jgi:hypothetical protein